jgi:drug/metabolite transporter (DMT)-like permease
MLTFLHMTTCWVLGHLLNGIGLIPLTSMQSRKQFEKTAILALVFSLSVVTGNISLKLIPISYNQAIGATTPVFTALFAALFQRRFETWQVYLSLVPIVMGVIIASGAEPLFVFVGFAAALFATAARAAKSVLQGVLLLDDVEKSDSLSLLWHMTPLAALFSFPGVLFFELDSFGFITNAATKYCEILLQDMSVRCMHDNTSRQACQVQYHSFRYSSKTAPLRSK